jgi:hypothetical protein
MNITRINIQATNMPVRKILKIIRPDIIGQGLSMKSNISRITDVVLSNIIDDELSSITDGLSNIKLIDKPDNVINQKLKEPQSKDTLLNNIVCQTDNNDCITHIEIKDTNEVVKNVRTEDLGKIFEMAICLLYEINYDGKYRYSMKEAQILKERLYKLKEVFPHKIKHIAKNGNKYDFVSIEYDNLYLSAKTTKKYDKVCPQVIGQPSKKKFCEFFEIDVLTNIEQIKSYIETNVNKLLEIYCKNTFDCPVIYYNKHKNKLLYVKLKNNINWSNYNISFSHIKRNKKWNESSSIIVENKTIGEFQVHYHRDCIKFRWSFEKLLHLFSDNFEVIEL